MVCRGSTQTLGLQAADTNSEDLQPQAFSCWFHDTHEHDWLIYWSGYTMVNLLPNGLCMDIWVMAPKKSPLAQTFSVWGLKLPLWSMSWPAKWGRHDAEGAERKHREEQGCFPNQEIWSVLCFYITTLAVSSLSFYSVLRLQVGSGGTVSFHPSLHRLQSLTRPHPKAAFLNTKSSLMGPGISGGWTRKSSQSVVGKSRTTGSFQPTRVSSTIAKHCGRVHQSPPHLCDKWGSGYTGRHLRDRAPASMATSDIWEGGCNRSDPWLIFHPLPSRCSLSQR